MHIPANPYESARYVVYALLAVAYVSMIWNRCNARNTYTKTWRIYLYAGVIAAEFTV